MLKKVIQVWPRDDFKVYVYFDDGKIKLFDMSQLITQGVFKQVSNQLTFIEKCTVLNGTLAWDLSGNFDPYQCIDVDPETIYETGLDALDPFLEKTA